MATNKIKDIPKLDRPREKLLRKGAQSLSEFELLQVIIGSGSGDNDVSTVAKSVQSLLSQGLDALTESSLVNIKGLNQAKATAILAAVELSKRYIVQTDQPYLKTEDFVMLFGDLAGKKQEYLVCATFDGARRLIAKRTVTVGTLDSVLAHPREVFTDAVADRAASVVIAHNHPSGNLEPSDFDIGFTQQIVAAARIIGISVTDHIIITPRGHLSFKDKGLLA